MMIGPYAGEIRDVKAIYAREMIQDGRALDPNAPLAAEVRVPVVPSEVPVVAAAMKRTSRQRKRR